MMEKHNCIFVKKVCHAKVMKRGLQENLREFTTAKIHRPCVWRSKAKGAIVNKTAKNKIYANITHYLIYRVNVPSFLKERYINSGIIPKFYF